MSGMNAALRALYTIRTNPRVREHNVNGFSVRSSPSSSQRPSTFVRNTFAATQSFASRACLRQTARLVIDAGGSRGVGRVTSSVSLFVCLFVCPSSKRIRLELTTPYTNSRNIARMNRKAHVTCNSPWQAIGMH